MPSDEQSSNRFHLPDQSYQVTVTIPNFDIPNFDFRFVVGPEKRFTSGLRVLYNQAAEQVD